MSPIERSAGGGGGGGGGSTDGWIADPNSPTFASASSFTAGSSDLTATYSKGTRIKLTQTTVKYFVVSSSSFGGGTTTVNITAGSDFTLANAAITSPFYSYEVNPQGYPGWFNFTSSATGFSSFTRNVARFAVEGRVCFIYCSISGTSNAGGSFNITAPIASANAFVSAMCHGASNTVDVEVMYWFNAATTSLDVYVGAGFGGFGGAGGKGVDGVITYQI